MLIQTLLSLMVRVCHLIAIIKPQARSEPLRVNLQAGMRWLESAYPDQARGWVGFNVPMSHKITAACDLLLMPSRFEPCGLNQLYAMRYGTVPVAHATGGLRDTVLPFNPWEGSHQPLPYLPPATHT